MGFGVRMEMPLTKEVADLMRNLETKAPAAVRRAMHKAIQIPKRTARQLAPKDTGLLRKNIGAFAYVRRDKTAVIGELVAKHSPQMVRRKGKTKPTKADPYYYMHLMELGTQPHAVGKGSKVWSRRPAKGYPGVRGKQGGSQHPGTRPYSFLRRAMEQNRTNMEAAVEAQLGIELDKIWNGN